MLTTNPDIIPFLMTPLAKSALPLPMNSGTNFVKAAGSERLKKVEKIVVIKNNEERTPTSYTVRNLVAKAKYTTPKMFPKSVCK